MCVAWKILPSFGCYVDNQSIPLKMFSSLFQNRALAPLQIPASLREGPIYLLFVELSPSYYKAPAGEHTVICIHYYWFILGMT